MHVYTYTKKNGNVPATAQLLADALDVALVQRGTRPPEGLLVNWGAQVPAREIPRSLNGRAPVTKFDAFKLLWDNDVPTPQYTELTGLLVRNKNTHHQGKDILTEEDAFLVEYIPKAREVRVDVYRKTAGKYVAFRGHVKNPADPHAVVWNRANSTWESYGTKTMRAALGDKPIQLAKDAVKALGYDFGAVDLVQDTEGDWFVLEVNSAPHLNEAGVEAYARRIITMEKDRNG